MICTYKERGSARINGLSATSSDIPDLCSCMVSVAIQLETGIRTTKGAAIESIKNASLALGMLNLSVSLYLGQHIRGMKEMTQIKTMELFQQLNSEKNSWFHPNYLSLFILPLLIHRFILLFSLDFIASFGMIVIFHIMMLFNLIVMSGLIVILFIDTINILFKSISKYQKLLISDEWKIFIFKWIIITLAVISFAVALVGAFAGLIFAKSNTALVDKMLDSSDVTAEVIGTEIVNEIQSKLNQTAQNVTRLFGYYQWFRDPVA